MMTLHVAVRILLLCQLPVTANEQAEQLWSAARSGEADLVGQLLAAGAPVDAKTAYDVTALSFACSRGHTDVVNVLLDAGADVNVKDSFYGSTALNKAISEKHTEIAKQLLEHGAKPSDSDLLSAIRLKDAEVVRRILTNAELSPDALREALKVAKRLDEDEIKLLLEAEDIPPPREAVQLKSDVLQNYVGLYETDSGSQLEITLRDAKLFAKLSALGGQESELEAVEERKFRPLGRALTWLDFDEVRDAQAPGALWKTGSRSFRYTRVDPNATVAAPHSSPAATAQFAREDLAASSVHWPQFRGLGARGLADGQSPPTEWDVGEEQNLKWKVPIPGLGHACPIVWGDRVYLTTAVGLANENDLRIGLYGDVDSVPDQSLHRFQVICLDKETGQVVWLRTATRAETVHQTPPQIDTCQSHSGDGWQTRGGLLRNRGLVLLHGGRRVVVEQRPGQP